MKSFIYCRQSVGEADPNESLSLNVQESECRKLAVSKSTDVIHVFKDPNTSGRLYPAGFESLAANDFTYQAWCQETKKIGKWRVQFGELLKRLDEIDTIICYDITRLHRSLNGSYQENLIKQILNANNIKVLTVKEGEVDFSRFTDSLVTSLTSQINSEQLLIQREKAKAGLKRLKDSGEYYSGFVKTIGYATTGRKTVEIVPHEADVVKEIFRMFIKEGLTLNEIVRQIGSKYPDVFPRCWTNTIKNILTNPIYAGYMRNTEGELIKSKQAEGKEIISLSDWTDADKIFSARRLSPYRHKSNWLPLTPYTYCGHCGEKMRTHLGENMKSSYSCQRHIRDKRPACKNTIMAFYDGKEGNGLFEAIRPLLVAEAIDRMKSSTNEKTQSQLRIIEANLSSLNEKEKKITSLWMNSSMTDEVYESSMAAIKSKRKDLEKERTSLNLSQSTVQFDWVKLKMKFTGDLFTNAEYDILISSLIKKILIYKDFIEVKTRLGDVTLPRQRVYKWRLVSPCDVQMKNNKANVYFYNGKFRSVSSEEKASAKLIGTIGDVSIYQIED